MAYVTSTQIVARLGNDMAVLLTTDSGSSVDTDLINTIIAEVEAEIDQVLRTRTTETITQSAYPQTFAMLRGKATAIVIFKLHLRRPPVAKEVTDDKNDAKAWLEKLAAGEVNLPDPSFNADAMVWGGAEQNAVDQGRETAD